MVIIIATDAASGAHFNWQTLIHIHIYTVHMDKLNDPYKSESFMQQ